MQRKKSLHHHHQPPSLFVIYLLFLVQTWNALSLSRCWWCCFTGLAVVIAIVVRHLIKIKSPPSSSSSYNYYICIIFTIIKPKYTLWKKEKTRSTNKQQETISSLEKTLTRKSARTRERESESKRARSEEEHYCFRFEI